MESVKETAANTAASAISGLEKTKATVQEKVEKATAHDPMVKEMATQRKQDRIRLAELDKQEVYHHNAAARQAGRDEYIAKGARGHQMTAEPTHHNNRGS
ncbi:18 kDa seed maturation protein [Hibiscus syriacus]|uniref:18 kDa seed maturation protein n=1 Tax=Hibiscus syriacus TaxID=106335 RepID=A0A6A2ZG98_HIBSY|nr:11 kDa late embryogenesis abundant protein-like [Hibiscus syriacus]KAE8689985.1 18 kDa seed maturation protein [Hibiscus syriacus]